MVFYGQTWFLSPIAGLVAVLIYYLCVGRQKSKRVAALQPDSEEATQAMNEQLNMYIGVFIVACVLVYGSFVVADMTGTCRFIDAQPDIQTGGCPPF